LRAASARAHVVTRSAVILVVAVHAVGCGAPGHGRDAARTSFAGLIEHLSEAGAYFDTDNVISNETSYLHAIDVLEEAGIRGGAYLGVGPDQNFSYIAAVRPEIAFIVDIRRDNMLQHLLFKALFAASDDRLEYLCLLVGRPAPHGRESWRDSSVAALARYVDTVEVRRGASQAARDTVADLVRSFGVPLSDEDRATITRVHETFIEAGLDLRFQSHGRPPRPHYPTLRQLVLETDRRGRQVSYLASEERWHVVDDLQDRDRVIPVVGDFAGDHALRAIADLLRARGIPVSAFYTSNVEFYLMGDGTFGQFGANVAGLPVADRSGLIRSFFGRNFGYVHPEAVPGYYSVQLVQDLHDFVATVEGGGYRSYVDLVMQQASVPARPPR
jgi:hypothetical protein